MILRIKEFAVIENGSPDTVVNLIPVTEGIDGSAVFGVSNEHNRDLKVADGQTYVDRANPSFNVSVLRPSGGDVTQLETWANNQTEVYISAVTVDGGFLFGDKQTASGPIKIRANQQVTDNDVYQFEVTRETTPGFDPDTGLHQSGFWAGSNLLGIHEWGDKDADTIADGWNAAGFTTTAFSGGQQTLEADTSTRALIKSVFFPFEGEQVTFSINNDSRTGTYNTEEIVIQFYDTSDSVISSQITTFSSTGRKSVTAITPSGSNLSYIQCRFRISASSGTVTSIVSDPALKLGTEATYSKF